MKPILYFYITMYATFAMVMILINSMLNIDYLLIAGICFIWGFIVGIAWSLAEYYTNKYYELIEAFKKTIKD